MISALSPQNKTKWISNQITIKIFIYIFFITGDLFLQNQSQIKKSLSVLELSNTSLWTWLLVIRTPRESVRIMPVWKEIACHSYVVNHKAVPTSQYRKSSQFHRYSWDYLIHLEQSNKQANLSSQYLHYYPVFIL